MIAVLSPWRSRSDASSAQEDPSDGNLWRGERTTSTKRQTWRGPFVVRLRKRKAIESYWRELPSQLERDYGKSKHYAAWQICQAVDRCGLDTDFSGYAFVIFMSAESFARLPHALGGTRTYQAKRQELADTWFSGDREFMARHGFAGPDVGKRHMPGRVR